MSDKLAPYRGWIGLDLMAVLSRDERLRPVLVNGEYMISGVGLMGVFGHGDTPARVQWNREKKRLAKRRPQLLQNMIQLKLESSDGKSYLTDAVSLETAYKILFYMDTPASDEFKDMAAVVLSKISDAQLRYRALNIARGMEWAADTIHQRLEDENLLGDES
ncbi:MAG: hypothetical protein BroJett018_37730 [Chloroflexota bacterium]|nr:hypothetical protein [Chloroflexota bacterium]NOG64432.1 hypothetical protein [Chloroflexota bacterium]GIK65979.1 MAG: hypothetical protein BroJett018_37730 [Chloroflexota bacterium]